MANGRRWPTSDPRPRSRTVGTTSSPRARGQSRQRWPSTCARLDGSTGRYGRQPRPPCRPRDVTRASRQEFTPPLVPSENRPSRTLGGSTGLRYLVNHSLDMATLPGRGFQRTRPHPRSASRRPRLGGCEGPDHHEQPRWRRGGRGGAGGRDEATRAGSRVPCSAAPGCGACRRIPGRHPSGARAVRGDHRAPRGAVRDARRASHAGRPPERGRNADVPARAWASGHEATWRPVSLGAVDATGGD